jgi:hypothetical protein
MRGILWASTLMVLIAGCMPAGAEFGGGPGGAILITEDMVPDPAYQPRVGDRAVLYAIENERVLDRLPLLKDLTAYDIYVRSQDARDSERLMDMEQQGWLHWAQPGTRIALLATQDRNHTGAHMAAQIRLTDGVQKDQTFWTSSDYVTRLIHKEPE